MNSQADNKIFEFAYGCAMSDAVQRNAYPHHKEDAAYGGAEYFPTPKSKLVSKYPEVMALIKGFIDEILSGKFDSSDKYNKRFAEVAKEAYELIKKDGVYEFTFGNIQKLINMTLKHIYILSYHNPSVRGNFRYCHCPLDVQISKKIIEIKFGGKSSDYLTKAGKTLSKKALEEVDSIWERINEIAISAKDRSWSSMGFEDIDTYYKIQNEIDCIRKTDPEKYGDNLIEFDYFIWNNADSEYITEF